jgi:hypothetical protein
MKRDQLVKLLTQTAVAVLASPELSIDVDEDQATRAVDSACNIVFASIKAAQTIESTGGLYDDQDEEGIPIFRNVKVKS